MNKNKGYVNNDYLLKAGQVFTPIKLKSYQNLGELAGKKVLDIGCGPGLDTNNIARLNPDVGKVHGIDFDQDMITNANISAKENNLDDKVFHQQGSAYKLPYEANQFDAIRAERLFMHLENPLEALAEIKRVAKPNAKLVIVETDWGSMSSHTGDDPMERKLTQHFIENFFNNGFSARALSAQLRQQNIELIDIDNDYLHTDELPLWNLFTQAERMVEIAVKQHCISEAEALKWQETITSTAAENNFYGSVNILTFTASL